METFKHIDLLGEDQTRLVRLTWSEEEKAFMGVAVESGPIAEIDRTTRTGKHYVNRWSTDGNGRPSETIEGETIKLGEGQA